MKNQGEIISLIVFVILTLALGVTTYFGFKNLNLQKAELASAQSELQNVQNDNNTLAAQCAEVQTRAGFDPALKTADVVAAMAADVDAALGAQGSGKSYKDAVAELKKRISTADKQIADAAAARDASVDSAFSSVTQAQDQQTAFDENVKTEQANRDDSLQTVRDDYDKLTKSFVDQTKRFDVVNRQAHDAIVTANEETAQNREIANRYADFNIDLSRRIDELSNPDFDRADGSVVYADQTGKIVRLNIGVDDGVRPLMTFQVFPPEIFEEGGVAAKGKIQVERTLEAHACEARILEDSAVNPILPGDLVYTSFWKPGEVDRYALDCRLDVNGDNISDLNELINLIEANGNEVAAYIDNDGNVHGKITPDVTRVVIPNMPLSSLLATDPELNDERRQAIVDTETAFLDEAKANGVRQMRLSDFLVRMDYKATDQVVRDANVPSHSGEKAVGDTRVAPVFDATPVVSGSSSQGVPKGTVAVEEEADSAERYFRKRAPNL